MEDKLKEYSSLLRQQRFISYSTLGCNRETVNALNIYLRRFAYNASDKVLHV